jgi:hypothetical protein
MNFVLKVKNIINAMFYQLGYRISKINTTGKNFNIYKYKNYEEYKQTQIFYNIKKINHVFADENNLRLICNFLKENIKSDKIEGICHGSRNGFEQNFFNKEITNSKVIGTDISHTAINYKNTVEHDFHDEKNEWKKKFDFVYSNSLDQSYDPKKALIVWLDQIKKDRYIILEHTEQHGVITSGKMDPFGVEANFFPFLLTKWFGHLISIKFIKSTKINKNHSPVYLFILKKLFD